MNMVRSFRLRVALLSSAATVAVLLLFSAFVHERLRKGTQHDVDAKLDAHARLVLAQPTRPIVWHEVDRRLGEQEPGTVVFAWMSGMGHAYVSADWPEAVDPSRIAVAAGIPRDWRDRVMDVHPDHLPRSGGRERRGAPDDGMGPSPRPGRGVVELENMPDAERVPGLRSMEDDDLRRYGAFTDGETTFVIGTPTAQVARSLAAFRGAVAFALGPAFALAFAAGFIVAGRSLRSVGRLTDAVERVTATGLDRRVDAEQAEREFRRLVEAFNGMLGRLERSFQESRRFTDNAAHEMRTPLTILQGKLDEAIRLAYPGSPQQQMFTDLLDEVARLKGIVDRLLLLARSDAGRLDLYRERVDVSALLESIAEDCTMLAPHLRFDAKVARGVHLVCDRALVAQVFHNLLSNAIKYNRREEGFVRVELRSEAGHVELRVANSGRPIKPADAERVFERFYRADQSHSRAIEGTGLGLSVAREIARAHGGDLVLERSDEQETAFALRLPATDDPKAE